MTSLKLTSCCLQELFGFGDEKARKVIRFNRLPERHNDMVFAVVVARFGLLGAIGVLTRLQLWRTTRMLRLVFDSAVPISLPPETRLR